MRSGKVFSLAIGVMVATTVFAADETTKEASTNRAIWKTTISAGGTMTKGNSDTIKGNVSLLVEGEKEELGSIRLGGELNYGESKVDDETRLDTDNGKLFAHAKLMLSKKIYAYGDASAQRDELAMLYYRVVLGPGLGLYLIKNDRASLSCEAGPSYMWEKKDEDRSENWNFRAAERFELKLSDTSRCWQSIEFLAPMYDMDDSKLNAEIGVEADIRSNLSLRLVLQDKYENQPAEERNSSDLTLITALSLKL